MNRIYGILDNGIHTEQKLPVIVPIYHIGCSRNFAIIKTSDIALKELKEMLAQYKKNMDVRIQQLEESIIRASADDEIWSNIEQIKKIT